MPSDGQVRGQQAVDTRPLGPAARLVAAQCGPDAIVPPASLAVGEGGWALTDAFLEYRDAIRDLEVRPSDVWILSFPKCGTTWTQEMVWLLGNGCNTEAARARDLSLRSPFLESTAIGSAEELVEESKRLSDNSIADVNAMPRDRPRFIKSHLPLELLPRDLLKVNPKIVYVSRDPRDACVSFYHHHRILNAYRGSLDDFFEAFLVDEVQYAPYWRHVLEFWKLAGRDNLLFLTYEEMKRDLRSVVRRTAAFLGTAIPAGREDAVLDHLSFGSMKANSSVNFEGVFKPQAEGDAFIRQGEAGGWRRSLSGDQARRMADWAARHLTGSDYPHFRP